MMIIRLDYVSNITFFRSSFQLESYHFENEKIGVPGKEISVYWYNIQHIRT